MRKPALNLGLVLWFALITFGLGGFNLYSLVSLLVVLALLLLAFQVEARTQPPLRSYGRLMVVSIFLFLIMVVGVAWSGGSVLFGASAWIAISLMGAIWVVHYERTEPREGRIDGARPDLD